MRRINQALAKRGQILSSAFDHGVDIFKILLYLTPYAVRQQIWSVTNLLLFYLQ